MTDNIHYADKDEQAIDHHDDDTVDAPLPTEYVTALELRDAVRESPPSTGWRGVCLALGVDPDLTGEPRDETTRAAIYDSERSRRNRRKHAWGCTS